VDAIDGKEKGVETGGEEEGGGEGEEDEEVKVEEEEGEEEEAAEEYRASTRGIEKDIGSSPIVKEASMLVLS